MSNNEIIILIGKEIGRERHGKVRYNIINIYNIDA